MDVYLSTSTHFHEMAAMIAHMMVRLKENGTKPGPSFQL